MKSKKNSSIDKLLNVMKKLRDKKNGCEWDKKQTLDTIIPHTIEEVYEVAEQVYKKNYSELKKELGDLLFQVIYLSQIAKEKNKFDFNDVVKTITKKMILRHPHVFNKRKFKNIKEFDEWWEKSKNKKYISILDHIPNTYPAMLKSYKIQKKVAKYGFDYSSNIEAINKIIEEANELKREVKKNKNKTIREELGDLIFACLDVSRKLNINPEIALYKTNVKFIKRWKYIEKQISILNKDINQINMKLLNELWEKSKLVS